MESGSSHSAPDIKDEVKAFKFFFEDFYPSVCVFANKYVKDMDLAEDITHEAFIEFWKIKEKFVDLRSRKGFIYTVTRNKCLNSIKQWSNQDKKLKAGLPSEDYFHEMVMEEETYRIVHLAVNKLAPQSRRIICLSMEGKKNQEIADQLNVSINTVKTLKKNAYEELRNSLKDHVFVLFLFNYFLN